MATTKKRPPNKTQFGHVMIDLETLGTTADCMILSIGAVRFNEKEIDDEAFYRVVTIESNMDSYRTFSGSTIRFWMRQGGAARADLFSEDAAGNPIGVELGTMLAEFRKWFSETPDALAYGNGSDFDLAILSHAYGQIGQKAPWKFWNSACFRTIKRDAKHVPVPPKEGTAHNALADAMNQARHLQAIWSAAKKVVA